MGQNLSTSNMYSFTFMKSVWNETIITEGPRDLLFNKMLYTGILDDVWGLLGHPRRRLLFVSKSSYSAGAVTANNTCFSGPGHLLEAKIPLRGEMPSWWRVTGDCRDPYLCALSKDYVWLLSCPWIQFFIQESHACFFIIIFSSGKYLNILFAILPSHLFLPVNWYQQHGWTEWGKS